MWWLVVVQDVLMCGWLLSGCPDMWLVVCQDVLMCGWLSSGCPDLCLVVVRMS